MIEKSRKWGRKVFLLVALAVSFVMPVSAPHVDPPIVEEEAEERFGEDPDTPIACRHGDNLSA